MIEVGPLQSSEIKRTQGVILRNSLFGADVAERIQLLLIFSAHTYFLSGCVVETREFSGTSQAVTHTYVKVWLACLAVR
jgi:hypothetical protein